MGFVYSRLLTLCCFGVLCTAPAVASTPARVVKVIDGDSLVVALRSGKEAQVRLTSIDAPEYDQPYGSEAREALAAMVGGKAIQLELDGADNYRRLLACPLVEGRNVCDAMVRQGAAWVYRRSDPPEHLLRLERRARDKRLGLWGTGAEPVAPWDWRAQKRKRPAVRRGAGCDIKGNISSSGARIYHVPGQRHYEQTRISPNKGERWFCSPQEARDAGWRASKR